MIFKKIFIKLFVSIIVFWFLALPVYAEENDFASLNNNYQLEKFSYNNYSQKDYMSFNYRSDFNYAFSKLNKAAVINQIGNYNFAEIKQGNQYISISKSAAFIHQYGNDNFILAGQFNTNNKISINQYGNNNFVLAEEFSKANNVLISQFGNNQKLKLYKY